MTKLVYAYGALSSGAKYAYTVDSETNKLFVAQIALFDSDTEEWYIKSQKISFFKAMIYSVVNSYRDMSEKQSVTHREIIDFFKTEAESSTGSSVMDAEIIRYIIEIYGNIFRCSTEADF